MIKDCIIHISVNVCCEVEGLSIETMSVLFGHLSVVQELTYGKTISFEGEVALIKHVSVVTSPWPTGHMWQR